MSRKRPAKVHLNLVDNHQSKRRLSIKRLTLPALRIEPSANEVSQSVSSSTVSQDQDGHDDYLDDYSNCAVDEQEAGCHPAQQYSEHEVRKEKLAIAWAERRSEILKIMVETNGFPVSQECVICGSCSATVWCKDCGQNAKFCTECAKNQHSVINICHRMTVWDVSYLNQ